MLCNTTPKGWGSTHIGETQIIKIVCEEILSLWSMAELHFEICRFFFR